jgi:hypothetical protein
MGNLNIKWQGFDLSSLYGAMANGFMSSLKSIIHGIPIPLVIGFAILLIAMGVFSFLKELKVI